MKIFFERYRLIQLRANNSRRMLVPKLKNIILTPITGGLFLLFIAICVSLYGHISANGKFDVAILFTELWGNIGTELGSIAITILIIDQLYKRQSTLEEKRRQDYERRIRQQSFEYRLYQAKTTEEKESLLFEMNLLGLLEGANLARIDFSGVKLGRPTIGTYISEMSYSPRHEEPAKVSLKGADLGRCNFSNADLTNVDLSNTRLGDAYFSNTKMDGVDLRNAGLFNSTFLNVSMRGANLEGLEFNLCPVSHLDLTNAKIQGVLFYKKTPTNVILPDGRLLEYKSDLEAFEIRVMSHFQYPEKPNH